MRLSTRLIGWLLADRIATVARLVLRMPRRGGGKGGAAIGGSLAAVVAILGWIGLFFGG
jgi:hypothetical protein